MCSWRAEQATTQSTKGGAGQAGTPVHSLHDVLLQGQVEADTLQGGQDRTGQDRTGRDGTVHSLHDVLLQGQVEADTLQGGQDRTGQDSTLTP